MHIFIFNFGRKYALFYLVYPPRLQIGKNWNACSSKPASSSKNTRSQRKQNHCNARGTLVLFPLVLLYKCTIPIKFVFSALASSSLPHRSILVPACLLVLFIAIPSPWQLPISTLTLRVLRLSPKATDGYTG